MAKSNRIESRRLDASMVIAFNACANFVDIYIYISKKIKSFAHQEYNNLLFSDLDKIKKRVESGKDLFDRDINYKTIEIDNSFPEYIQKNKDKLSDWII